MVAYRSMLSATMLATLPWLALGGVSDASAVDRFDPSLERQLVGFQDVDFDSGWVPAAAPVQLRFYAHAADAVIIEMLGEATYDWAGEEIAFDGDPGGGLFAMDVGLQLQASVRFDVAGLQWQSDLLGPWDYAIISDALFTPYLLPGNPDAPVTIDDQTDGATIASVPIVPDIILVSGNLDVDVAAHVTAQLEGIRIEATTEGDGAIVDAEGVPSPLTAADAEAPLLVDGVMVAGLQSAPVLVVRPHLVMSILGQNFEIIGIDIPIVLPETDEELVFDPEPMLFEPPPPPSGDGGVDESGGGSGVEPGDGGGSSGGDGTGTGGEGETDTDGSGGLDEAPSGCGCRSSGPQPLGPGMLGWLVLGLGALSRRRA